MSPLHPFPHCGRAVYAVALNFRAELARLTGQLPVAPVLYLRPRNTWSASGAAIRMPSEAKELKMAGTIGVVIGSGYVAVNDVSIPHESYFRPAIRQRCRDGFCVIGSDITEHMPEEIRISINGEVRCRVNIAGLVRPIDQLIADINEFLTLQPGDILLIGEPPDAPLARPGDRVRVEIDGVSAIENEVVAE
ncbi:MAG TPA: fumarylacetoacetate hydrolase family protein [Bryobacteraceae bacterium]|nr:fumarylacetoacetate hydrolase family protein [Bryobacteraceae bacterium]